VFKGQTEPVGLFLTFFVENLCKNRFRQENHSLELFLSVG
jgi:hypothetical protein